MQSAIELLACPRCHHPLHPGADPQILQCDRGHTAPIEDGVLILSREDAPSDPWSHTTADYAAYKQKVEAPKQDDRDVIAALTARAGTHHPSVILDICTGRGALLFDLMQHLDALFISVDKSPTIQTHNCRYQRERFPHRDVEAGPLFPYPDEPLVEMLYDVEKDRV